MSIHKQDATPVCGHRQEFRFNQSLMITKVLPSPPPVTHFDLPVRILILEHDSNDLDLLLYTLNKSGIPYQPEIVETKKAFRKAIIDFSPDIILSDFSLPSFDGTSAFEIRQALAPCIPFIFVSGNIGEETSIELIKNGLTDYVMKDKLFTLVFKMTRALRETREKEAKYQAEQNLIKNEFRLSQAQKIAKLGSWEKDPVTSQYIWSEQLYHILGYSTDIQEPTLDHYLAAIHPEDLEYVKHMVRNAEMYIRNVSYEHRVIHPDGSIRYVRCESKNDAATGNGKSRRHGIVQDVTERKLAEQQKDFDSQNLKALINNTSEMMWSVDLDCQLITSNQSFDRLIKTTFGRTPKKGDNLIQMAIYGENGARYQDFYQRAFSGESFSIFEHITYPDEIWLEISFYPIRHENEVIGTACFSRDMTERKLFEKELEKSTQKILGIKNQLEKSEKSLKQAQKMAGLCSWETDNKTGQTHWSDESQEIFGIQKPLYHPLQIDLLEFIHKEDLDIVKKAMSGRNAMLGYMFNSRICRTDGSVRYIYCNCRPSMNEKGTITGMNGIIHDITDSQLAKHKIMHSEARMKQAQGIAHVGSWELDFSTKKSYWSDEAYRIYGMAPGDEQITFEAWMRFVHPGDRRSVMRQLRTALDTYSDASFYHRILHRDGTERYVWSTSRYDFDKSGKANALYGIVHDLTEQKHTEIQLQQLLDVTREQNKRLKNFAYIISHNIRSHSSNIIGLVDMFSEAGDGQDRLKFFNMLKTSTEKLGETIDNLNEVITIQNDTRREKESVNISLMADKIAKSLEHIISETSAQLINQVEKDLVIEIIPDYFESILMNLVSNSIRYRSPEKPCIIRITATRSGKHLELCVEDNGIGIDLEKNRDKVFGMYKTFHKNDNARGLGLFMTKNRVEAMNGRIEVESRPGEGCRFKVYLQEQAPVF
jgi:PAS domain S-box-containing protein